MKDLLFLRFKNHKTSKITIDLLIKAYFLTEPVYGIWQQQLQWIFYLLFTLFHNTIIQLFLKYPHR